MYNNLIFNLERKSHPYPDYPGASLEIWGILSIAITSDQEYKTLLVWEWDLGMLDEWFKRNRSSICHETLLIIEENVLPLESLAQALNRFQNKDISNWAESLQDEFYERLFQFRERHSLRFALRGADIPDIIIGINNGNGEISLINKDEDWFYQFNMDDFCKDLQRKLKPINDILISRA